MIVKQDETRNSSIRKRTLDGFLVNINLVQNAVNQLLKPTQYGNAQGFDASQVNVKVILRRNGKDFLLVHDNLGILGQYNSILHGSKNWFLGTDLELPTATLRHTAVRTLFLSLGGHINLGGDDEIIYEITVGRQSFNSDLQSASCYVQITPNFSIGKEIGIFLTKSHVIQTGETRGNFNLGSNVTRIAFLNFEDTGMTQQIIQNLNLASDRLDLSLSLADIINRHGMNFPYAQWHKYKEYNSQGGDVDTYQVAYPQSFIFHDAQAESGDLDEVSLDLTFDGSKVLPSKNYLVYTNYYTSMEILRRSAQLNAKHAQENVSKVPETL